MEYDDAHRDKTASTAPHEFPTVRCGAVLFFSKMTARCDTVLLYHGEGDIVEKTAP